MCICETNNYRAECFRYDHRLDRCDQCFSNGRCFRGDLQNANGFLCICRSCTQGTHCEFSLQAFGFTLDSLLASETTILYIFYMIMVVCLFTYGLFNNYCSFVTFKRTQPRKHGAGNYLMLVTILSQCSLLFLLLKFISISLGTMGLATNLSCKMISYLFLSVFTRSTYWLTSWITISRLLTILFPTSTTIKKPRFPIYSSFGTVVVVFAMHIHEPIYHKILSDPGSSSIRCVMNFNGNLVEIYNRVNTLIHYLLPFCIQIISINLLILLAARSRARTASNRNTFRQALKRQISTQKELYITPVAIILSALPQVVLSSSLACTELNSWKQHTLLVGILLSYVPQILGFILYVLPSSAYKKEFEETGIAKKAFQWMFKTNAKKTNT